MSTNQTKHGSMNLLIMDKTEQYQFLCGACGRYYKHKFNLKKHQRYECGKDPQFHCHLCPYKAKQKSVLQTHQLLKHKHQKLL